MPHLSRESLPARKLISEWSTLIDLEPCHSQKAEEAMEAASVLVEEVRLQDHLVFQAITDLINRLMLRQ
jgi:hypothetical protein